MDEPNYGFHGASYLKGEKRGIRQLRRSVKTMAAMLYRDRDYPPPKNPRTNQGKLKQYDYCVSLAFRILDGQTTTRTNQSIVKFKEWADSLDDEKKYGHFRGESLAERKRRT